MAAKIWSTKKNKKIIFRNSPCVVTLKGWDSAENDSLSQKGLSVLKNCDILISDGVFIDIGENLLDTHGNLGDIEIIDASKYVIVPGMIDCHNHPIFAGSRANETVLKSQGMTYEDISAKGGGIVSTMKATRKVTGHELSELYKLNAKDSLARGVVLLEAKTGYGLNPLQERKMLEALYEAHSGKDAMDLPHLCPTYLGPHAASPEYRGLDNYIQALVEDLPNIAALGEEAVKKGIAFPLAADIFLERNYFTKEQSERWLGAALQHGLDVHIHADEFSRSGGAELAAELARRLEQTASKRRKKGRVLTVDHCQYATESDLGRLAVLGVGAVALPTTSFFSKIPYVDAKRWRASGIKVAIGTDFNPGSSPMNNIWFSSYLALSQCGFSLAEVIAGVTINAAFALGLEKTYGSIEIGKKASLVAFDGASVEDYFSSLLGDHVRHVVV
ncbi:amidohydrolase family protein [Fluviispira multicolorata]|uniref:imidazolonepropionase n=1 Tax=Fluviispira multicolorata TaxID=2654512 RepID=A0A833JFT7_9BACT|nr:amidohydrolase family protein [Fluviispira multicolorata]KAB8031801.1 amidohydrolase family protein [Fluviispira multicolorata]